MTEQNLKAKLSIMRTQSQFNKLFLALLCKGNKKIVGTCG